MSVFISLAEEHALLLSLVDRLDRAAPDSGSRSAAKDARNVLLVLLRALDAHEKLEHLIFEEEPEGAALALVARQHLLLSGLRTEAAHLLKGLSREGYASMRGLIRRLTRLLRRHFEDEERTLWPRFNASAGRSRLQRLDRLARAQVRALKKEIDGYWVAFDDELL